MPARHVDESGRTWIAGSAPDGLPDGTLALQRPRARRPLIAGAIAALAVAGAMALPAAAGIPREVELSDARRPPTVLSYLQPGERVSYAHGRRGWNCRPRGFFSDVQAYHWDATALAPQAWNRTRERIYWRSVRGRVTFDGITFRNRTRAPVIVAGWCEL